MGERDGEQRDGGVEDRREAETHVDAVCSAIARSRESFVEFQQLVHGYHAMSKAKKQVCGSALGARCGGGDGMGRARSGSGVAAKVPGRVLSEEAVKIPPR